jgi:hypothetical protein
MRSVSVGVNLVAGTKTTIFTVPPRQVGNWTLLYALNGTSSAKNFNCWWYDTSANTEVYITHNYPITAAGFLRIDGQAYVVLEEGDEIRAQIETGATNASCIVTLELTTQLAVIKQT